MGKQCQICGENSYLYYPFCKKHLEMKSNGLLQKCENCGKWYIKGEKCSCQNESKEPQEKSKTEELKEKSKTEILNKKYDKCIICGQPSNGQPQCNDCYTETKEFMDGIDRYADIRKLRNHYYNLKDYIYRQIYTNEIKNIKSNCNQLIAIARMDQNNNKDYALIDRVFDDTEEFIKKNQEWIDKQKKNKQPEKTQEEEKEENKVYYHYAEDGHAMDSDMEILIDDILYNKMMLHCVHKSVTEITEKNIVCDWFIPITNMGEGIYIEYWGRKDRDYETRKNEKIELYKKHNLPLIQIRKDEPKGDSQTFKANLERNIRNKAMEEFGFMPKWCNPNKSKGTK